MRKGVIAVVFVFWVFFIFYNSSQIGKVSHNISYSIVRMIDGDIENGYYKDNKYYMSEEEKKLNYVVRKMAHFIEYLCLTIIIFFGIRMGLKFNNFRQQILGVLIISLIIALLDEGYQYFIPGRTSALGDVFIDFSGSLSGIWVVCIIFKIKDKFSLKNNNII